MLGVNHSVGNLYQGHTGDSDAEDSENFESSASNMAAPDMRVFGRSWFSMFQVVYQRDFRNIPRLAKIKNMYSSQKLKLLCNRQLQLCEKIEGWRGLAPPKRLWCWGLDSMMKRARTCLGEVGRRWFSSIECFRIIVFLIMREVKAMYGNSVDFCVNTRKSWGLGFTKHRPAFEWVHV